MSFETTESACPKCNTLLLTCALGESVALPWTLQELPATSECQWCDASIPAGEIACPACGADLPDASLQIPGVNVPLSEEHIRALMTDVDADELF